MFLSGRSPTWIDLLKNVFKAINFAHSCCTNKILLKILQIILLYLHQYSKPPVCFPQVFLTVLTSKRRQNCVWEQRLCHRQQNCSSGGKFIAWEELGKLEMTLRWSVKFNYRELIMKTNYFNAASDCMVIINNV